MACDLCGGKLQDKKVTYSIEYNNRLHIVEHVPVKECMQCGERLYSPEIVKNIQNAVWQNKKPDKIIKTPVIEYASIT
ncbi:MAG: YgiT-type zinc finger protein [Spirochaetes bacterium]|nr:YgiT-type zinc finger protein [Spirochaetota bacterium]